ncbi:FHIPEP family type III secretion protein [Escherichia coli]|nr:FHIPEP family type III secretion protein [Escherichia coli]
MTQEADFYGSMDGASKFVRGDAIAGILIMVINVVGGLLVGVLQHGMSMGHAAESYTLLTIGDGLVAQIPALVISTAAGVIVTRVSTDQDVGEQMVNQLFSNPSVMLLSAAVLGLLGLVPVNAKPGIFAVHCRIAGAGLVDPRTRTKSACRTKTGKNDRE